MTPIITLRDISKYYDLAGERFYALNSLSLDINSNDYVAIIGPSGSGKTSLMNVLGCLDTPNEGSYRLAGQDIAHLSEYELASVRNKEVGFIFQSFNLLPRASVLANVMQPLVYRFISNRNRQELAKDALHRVGLSDKADHLPNQLSGGQRQRVAIARALVTRPSILLGDEPTGNLDSKTTNQIMTLFDELHQEGHTVILVTHEQEIADHCRRVIRLVDGQLSQDTARMTGETLHV